MPTYEYICESCNYDWEIHQKMTDPVIKECPKCKKLKAKRLVSGGLGFQLKGNGWASEGYK